MTWDDRHAYLVSQHRGGWGFSYQEGSTFGVVRCRLAPRLRRSRLRAVPWCEGTVDACLRLHCCWRMW